MTKFEETIYKANEKAFRIWLAEACEFWAVDPSEVDQDEAYQAFSAGNTSAGYEVVLLDTFELWLAEACEFWAVDPSEVDQDEAYQAFKSNVISSADYEVVLLDT